MSDQPNFLMFITDQHRADHLGCYGNEIVQTPNIDGIAAKGTKFEKFYVACPICMPNRATLMTGRMPSLHGVRQNGIPLPLNTTTFTEILLAAGYQTALFGKSHLQCISANPVEVGLPSPDPTKFQPPTELAESMRGIWENGDYEQELPPTWKDKPNFEPGLPFYGFNELALAIGHSDRVTGHYARWLAERHPDPDSLRGPDNALASNRKLNAPQAWRTAIPEELYPTTYVAEKTIDFIKSQTSSDKTKPFFVQCSFPDPHHPFTPPGKYFDMYDPADIPTPEAFHHPKELLPPNVAALHKERDLGKANKNGQRGFGCTEQEAREAIALNYGSISMIDDAIGRVLTALDETGKADNTIVIFTTDHGDFMGDHQLLLKAAIHYQGLIRVPCIWSDPKTNHGGTSSSAFTGTIDLASSFLDRAGIQEFNGMQGLSLGQIAAGAPGHDSMVIEESQRRGYMGFQPNFRARSLVADHWRLTLYSDTDWGELYNLANDPNEFENLWDDPGYQRIRTELLERLTRRMMDLSDSSPLSIGHGP
ncbi:MAG: sulfatase-like hydrolase/transferase [Pseudomonadota bacterium]|nr:sulfatase-like hydrolase/transferase [Pseudomonadota bacterium]